jgi:hypothetical protein
METKTPWTLPNANHDLAVGSPSHFNVEGVISLRPFPFNRFSDSCSQIYIGKANG